MSPTLPSSTECPQVPLPGPGPALLAHLESFSSFFKAHFQWLSFQSLPSSQEPIDAPTHPHPCLLAHFRPQRATPVGGACPQHSVCQREDRPCGGPAGCPRPLCGQPKTEMTEGNRRCEDRMGRDSVCLGAGRCLAAGLELPPACLLGLRRSHSGKTVTPYVPVSPPLCPERQGTWEQSLHRQTRNEQQGRSVTKQSAGGTCPFPRLRQLCLTRLFLCLLPI